MKNLYALNSSVLVLWLNASCSRIELAMVELELAIAMLDLAYHDGMSRTASSNECYPHSISPVSPRTLHPAVKLRVQGQISNVRGIYINENSEVSKCQAQAQESRLMWLDSSCCGHTSAPSSDRLASLHMQHMSTLHCRIQDSCCTLHTGIKSMVCKGVSWWEGCKHGEGSYQRGVGVSYTAKRSVRPVRGLPGSMRPAAPV
ncbi:hypothetical protein EDB86DRAFT_2324956 [Lactarius hatsudake]|nr:hypothetical protein EDB86DRAFT_2324956 [Lactarius hatsudake]